MSLAKKIARHILADELAELRWETVTQADQNWAAIFEALARLARAESKSLGLRSAESLEDWEASRR